MARSRDASAAARLRRDGWRHALRRALAGYLREGCPDLAAGLTFHSVLSLVPGLLVVTSVLGLLGQGEQTSRVLLQLVRDLSPASVEALRAPIEAITGAGGSGLALGIGITAALLSASGYVNAFGRALNRLYGVPEGRPAWLLRPLMLLVTALVLVLVCVVLLGLILSGPVAEVVSRLLGIPPDYLDVFRIAKWPLMLLFVAGVVGLLYWATPNVRLPRFRWLSPGALVAIGLWVVASGLFGLYVANFGRWDRVYGALAGLIVGLIWLWLTNMALIFGGSLDAEIERARELQAGEPAERSLQLPLRGTRLIVKRQGRLDRLVEDGSQLRGAGGRVDPAE